MEQCGLIDMGWMRVYKVYRVDEVYWVYKIDEFRQGKRASTLLL